MKEKAQCVYTPNLLYIYCVWLGSLYNQKCKIGSDKKREKRRGKKKFLTLAPVTKLGGARESAGGGAVV